MHVCTPPVRKPRSRITLAFFAAVAALLAATSAHAQQPDNLRLQLLSGKTGRPVTTVHLVLTRDSQGNTLDGAKANAGLTTDGEGYITVPNTDAGFVVINVDAHQPCSRTFKRTFSLADVRARGIVSENSCSKRIHMFPQAGTLILFVRDETFWEKMKH